MDLKELEITTVTLPVSQALRPRASGAEELLIVQAGRLAATVRDSIFALGPGGVLLAMASPLGEGVGPLFARRLA